MEDFFINPKTIYQLLKSKRIEYLYHANTVLTSLTFIQQRALLSRNFVEKGKLIQTEQKSDKEDKIYNVWDDVFLDGLDLHKKYTQANKYGPVLFVMKLDLLLAPSLPPLLVTKNNPLYWQEQEGWEHRYYKTAEEIERDYNTGKKIDARIMFTLRSPENFIQLNKYLKGVIIDKPRIVVSFASGKQKNIGENAYEKIRHELDNNGMRHIHMKFRHADDGIHYCSCYIEYNRLYTWNGNELKKRFRSISPAQ